jgi:hypothetical protein
MEAIEVTEAQYLIIINKCAGVVFHKKAEGKFYIKPIGLNSYEKYVKDFLK